jgi:hypothetical protein
MKQCIVLFLCVMLVMLAGYVMQKEDVLFGPMSAVVAEPIPPEPVDTVEKFVPDIPAVPASVPGISAYPYSGGDDVIEANAINPAAKQRQQ